MNSIFKKLTLPLISVAMATCVAHNAQATPALNADGTIAAQATIGGIIFGNPFDGDLIFVNPDVSFNVAQAQQTAIEAADGGIWQFATKAIIDQAMDQAMGGLYYNADDFMELLGYSWTEAAFDRCTAMGYCTVRLQEDSGSPSPNDNPLITDAMSLAGYIFYNINDGRGSDVGIGIFPHIQVGALAYRIDDTPPPTGAPEPAMLGLLGVGIMLMGTSAYRFKKSQD